MSIQESIQDLARGTMAHQRFVSFAVVVQVDHKRNRAKVRLMPHGEPTGFLRIATAYAGGGWSMHFPIEKDDEVIVEFPSGQLHAGVITWRLHSDADQWPNRDEFKDRERKFGYRDVCMMHKSGSFLRFFGEDSSNTKNGKGENHAAGDIFLRAKGHGNFRVEADNRIEFVAPEIRIHTPDGKDQDRAQRFVLSEWVNYWNDTFLPLYNNHTHPPIPHSHPLTGLGVATHLPTQNGHTNTIRHESVCDMHIHGTLG